MLDLMSFNMSLTLSRDPPSANSPEANYNKALANVASVLFGIFLRMALMEALAVLT